MLTFYTVVQCVPDPVVNERVNIGVIVYGDGHIRSRFVSSWNRVKNIGVGDVTFLRDFVQRVRDAEAGQQTLPGVPGLPQFDEEALRRIIGKWASGIQFSEPKGSLRDPDAVLDDAASRFLHEDTPFRHRYRGRRVVAAIAQDTVAQKLSDRGGPAAIEHLMHKRPEIPGRLEEHRVDVAVANGRWHFAVHGMSFELDDVERLELQYSNVVYAVSDVRNRIRELPLGIIVLPPRPDSGSQATELYERAVRVFPKAGAEILTEITATDWIADQVKSIPEAEFGHGTKHLPPVDEDPTLFPLSSPSSLRKSRRHS